MVKKTKTIIDALSLIDKGLLPNELIPEFTMNSLSTKIEKIDFKKSKVKSSKSITYSIPKVSHSRRILNIPNPLHQYRLSKEIEDNWYDLEAFIGQSKLSLTTPIISQNGKNALERKHSLKDRVKFKIHNSIGKNYVLKTDISRYYPSIYTHSIPWGLHGKDVAKSNFSSSLLGNRLDTCLRNTQDKQSMGIPVGPDTSLLLAEILGTAIDLELQSELPNIIGTRYIDDYELYFETEQDALNAFSKLERIIKSYQLDLNPNKYYLIKIPDDLEPRWISDLKLYHIRKNSPLEQYYDLISFFNKAFIYSKEFPKDGVLKYCIKKLSEEKIFPENWDVFESFLLNVVSLDASSLPLIKIIFHTYDWHYKYELDRNKISSFLQKFITDNINLNNNYEVLWALSIIKSMDIKLLDDKLINKLFNYEDPLCSIILLDMYTMSSFLIKPDFKRIFTKLNKEELYGENWLLSYYGGLNEFVSPGYILDDEFFGQLYHNGISFYDPTIGDAKREIYETLKEDSFREMIKAIYENENSNGY
ncbi:RNA-directed DNA polymerase [Rossellomorea aquimaris]|uniref:RNA-directed DNA polymerase n=1 Tax=Rossellomorea aquimaris TaxID=189382 RepID=A0A5D4UIA9_9BACI|nr:RNA-directed DNA polymerase [Rossellomorea aquimaris]TYS77618.1 RNA-directed DNA polymerase [Rossellomorea aquimaris]TYS86800.1 RNA-directed DNA polymerase [Rossellomorea aquimaris]TYS87603.1 RNA-directed DNA polymerase [Rossellomorea aquimaris]